MAEAPGSIVEADVAVVGAGPAGLMAAIVAGQDCTRVIVCEQLERPGARLLATGGGRCNLTNTLDTELFMRRFGRQGRFMAPALEAMDSPRLRQFFAALDVPTYSPDGVCVYPSTNSALTVQQALLRRCRELGVELHAGRRIDRLLLEQGRLTGLEGPWGTLAAPRVVLAAGGRSYPPLGGTGGGYALAAQAGHTIVPTTPALVPLIIAQTYLRACAGVSVSGARVWVDLPRHARAGVTGDVLFTHAGLSGPAVLDLSGDVAVELARGGPVPIRLCLTPHTTAAQWLVQFDRWQQAHGASVVRTLLRGTLPASLIEAICRHLRLPDDARAAHLLRPQRAALAEALTALPLSVTATEGFDKAIVTRGGVALRQVDPHRLESRLLPGLFLAGEMLDLDGPCGGFNLQWAFASGHLAGRCAAERPLGGRAAEQ